MSKLNTFHYEHLIDTLKKEYFRVSVDRFDIGIFCFAGVRLHFIEELKRQLLQVDLKVTSTSINYLETNKGLTIHFLNPVCTLNVLTGKRLDEVYIYDPTHKLSKDKLNLIYDYLAEYDYPCPIWKDYKTQRSNIMF